MKPLGHRVPLLTSNDPCPGCPECKPGTYKLKAVAAEMKDGMGIGLDWAFGPSAALTAYWCNTCQKSLFTAQCPTHGDSTDPYRI